MMLTNQLEPKIDAEHLTTAQNANSWKYQSLKYLKNF